MALIVVCENHPRRTRGLLAFTYTDADGITYVSHFCPECAEDEADDEFYDWQPVEGGYCFDQRASARWELALTS